MSNNKQIAETILSQLGGNKFITMTGAKNFVAIENGLTFKIGSNHKSINFITITLNSNDLYDMKFEHVRQKRTSEITRKIVDEYNDLFFDQLQEFFTTATGMYTSL